MSTRDSASGESFESLSCAELRTCHQAKISNRLIPRSSTSKRSSARRSPSVVGTLTIANVARRLFEHGLDLGFRLDRVYLRLVKRADRLTTLHALAA